MKKIIKCLCGIETWYAGGSVAYVDACRRLDKECKCGEKNE
tara:strand:+ start:1558 stop:1680 length:123 start_codon:yes stop_codon:yes gene_type:complete